MSHVEQIKEKLTIVDVVGTYIKLEKAGSNFKALCPFHHEKTPSFFISPGRNSFYCFGCGMKGDIFSFVEQFEGLDFRGSLKILAEKAGVKLDNENYRGKDEKDRLYSCLEAASAHFVDNLQKKLESKPIIDYLLKRGLSRETINEWKIGYVFPDWHSTHLYLKSQKFTDQEIEKAGLIKKAEEDNGKSRYYDRFRGRIMFPICDSGGRTIGFSGRIYIDDEKSAKYLNSPETELFNKSNVLFGLNKAKLAIREKDEIILVEGQMDILLAHQSGTRNVVALSGTALTEDHIELLHRFSNRIIFAFDPDRAGVNATRRSTIIALKGDMEVKVASLPKGEDPADLIRNDPKKWHDALTNATHIIFFSLEKVLSAELTGKKLISEIKEHVFPFIYPLPGQMERYGYIKEISKKTGISEEAVLLDYKDAEKKFEEDAQKDTMATSSKKNTPPEKSHRYLIERRIYGIIKWQEGIPKQAIDPKEITERLAHIVGEDNFKQIKDIFEPSKNELAIEAEVLYGSLNINDDLEELFKNLEQDYLKVELSAQIEKLGVAEKDRDKNLIPKILNRCKELTEKLSKLK